MTRSEAIEDLKTLKEFFTEEFGAIPLSIKYAIDELSVEPKTGHWKTVRKNFFPIILFECPFCGERVLVKTNFCAKCGADMRGTENE